MTYDFSDLRWQAQPPLHAASNTSGFKQQPEPVTGGYCRQAMCQQEAIPNNMSKSALLQLQQKGTAIDPVNSSDGANSVTCTSGGGFSVKEGHSLDGKESITLSFIQQSNFQAEQGSATQLRQTLSSALQHKQSRRGTSVHISEKREFGLQLSLDSHKQPSRVTQFSPEQAVKEALAVSVSKAMSAGDEHLAGILQSMHGQMVSRMT